MNRSPSLLALALSLLPGIGCQQDREPPETPSRAAQLRDSAGVRITENPLPPEGTIPGWEINPEPSLSIGKAEGEAPYLLHRIRRAATLSDGRIVVADGSSNEVRIFDPDGIHLVSWGGEGEGPGEFERLSGVARWTGDSVAAWNFNTQRGVSIFDSEGNLGRTISLGPEPNHTRIAVLRVGAVLREFWIRPPEGPGTLYASGRYEIMDDDGGIAASLGTHPASEHFRYDYQGMALRGDVVFSRSVISAAWSDLAVVSPNHGYEIRAYATDGVLRRIVRLDRPLIPATRSLLMLDFEDLMRHRATRLSEVSSDNQDENVATIKVRTRGRDATSARTMAVAGERGKWERGSGVSGTAGMRRPAARTRGSSTAPARRA